MRNMLLVLGAAVLLATGVAASIALAGNPHGEPPGQGDCSHGATGKDCKPDPGPGKDCEEHGNHGGVNEDHCLPDETTPTDTTPTDTTPTDTTPTDTTPTTPTETTPTETTPTTPQPPRCPPGTFPLKGKDGKPGNDECCPDNNGNGICDEEETPPQQNTLTDPEQGTAAVQAPAAVAAPAAPAVKVAAKKATAKKKVAVLKKPDKPKPSTKIVKVKQKPNGVVEITTSDGKKHTGIMGSG